MVVIKDTKLSKKETIRFMDTSVSANMLLTDLPIGQNVTYSMSPKAEKYGTLSVSGNFVPKRDGSVKVTVRIGDGKFAAKRVLKIKIKTVRFAKDEDIIIKSGKSKLIGLKNTNKKDPVKWTLVDTSKASIEVKNNKVKVTGVCAGTTTLIGELEGRRFTKKIVIE